MSSRRSSCQPSEEASQHLRAALAWSRKRALDEAPIQRYEPPRERYSPQHDSQRRQHGVMLNSSPCNGFSNLSKIARLLTFMMENTSSPPGGVQAFPRLRSTLSRKATPLTRRRNSSFCASSMKAEAEACRQRVLEPS